MGQHRWNAINNGMANAYTYALAISDKNIFAGGGPYGVFRSTNNGANWIAANNGLQINYDSLLIPYVNCLAVLDTNLFAGTDCNGVFLSTNNGTSWSSINSGLTSSIIYSLAVNNTNLFAGTYGAGGLFLSTNNGTSWTAASTGLTYPVVERLAVLNNNLFAGTWSDGVFLSTNNGTSWTVVNNGLTNTNITAFAISDQKLFVGTGDGVFLSTNNGMSWTAVNTGLTNMAIYALAVSGTNLFAGTDGGVWRRSLSEMRTSVESMNDAPTYFNLGQNYPNPFNPTTEIDFVIPKAAYTTLKIYDILGREVSTLISKELKAGHYSKKWNAAGFSSGIYFYTLRSGSFIETKKLFLQK